METYFDGEREREVDLICHKWRDGERKRGWWGEGALNTQQPEHGRAKKVTPCAQADGRHGNLEY